MHGVNKIIKCDFGKVKVWKNIQTEGYEILPSDASNGTILGCILVSRPPQQGCNDLEMSSEHDGMSYAMT